MPGIPKDLAVLALGQLPLPLRSALQVYDNQYAARLFEAESAEVSEIFVAAGISRPFELALNLAPMRQAAIDAALEVQTQLRLNGARVVLDSDPAYPGRLRSLADRPRWLFTLGDADLLKSARLITIVGTRQPELSEQRLASRVTEILLRHGSVVVSGLAEGIDATAHRTCVELGAPTVAIVGTDLFHHYPANTAYLRQPILSRGGAIITEVVPGRNYPKGSFVQRDRILAGLAHVVIPIGNAVTRGTAHTIRWSMKYARNVIGVKWPGEDLRELNRHLTKAGYKTVDVCETEDAALVDAIIASPDSDEAVTRSGGTI